MIKIKPRWVRKQGGPNRARAQTIVVLTANLTLQLGHPPTDEQVAGMMAMSIAKLKKLRGF